MSRSRILAIAAVLPLLGEALWLLWPRRAEVPDAPSVGESIRQRQQPLAEDHTVSDLFTFEHEGRTVTINLSGARRGLKNMVRRDLVTVSTNDGAGAPEPGVGFLSWPNRRCIGRETVKTRKCYVLDFTNPSARPGGGPYYLVRIFVQEDGALIRMQSYNWDGRLEMGYTVERAKRSSDGTITPFEARAHYYEPGTKKVTGTLQYVARP